MKNANIRLGLRCNLNCRFCTTADDTSNEMTLDEVRQRIISLRRQGFDVITLTGGEPTLRNDLAKIIAYAKAFSFKNIDLQTNGIKLAKEDYLLGLKEAGLNYLTIGFSSHIESIYNCLTGSAAFKNVVKGIENAIRHNMGITVYHVINSENYNELTDFIDFIRNISPDIHFAFAFLRPNGNTKRNKYLVPRLVEIEYFLHTMFEHLEKYRIFALLEGVPLCYMPEFEERSAETWRMMQPAVAYISEDEIKHENLHGDINKYLKVKSEVCRICAANNFCAGIWKEYAEIHGTSELYPIFVRIGGTNG